MPITASDDDQIEFCDELESTLIIKSADAEEKLGRGALVIQQEWAEQQEWQNDSSGEDKQVVCSNIWFLKKARRRGTRIAPNARNKNEIDYVLISAQHNLKDVSKVPPSTQETTTVCCS